MGFFFFFQNLSTAVVIGTLSVNDFQVFIIAEMKYGYDRIAH